MYVLKNQETLLGRGTWVESRRLRARSRTALPVTWSLGFYADGISFQVVSGWSFWLRVLPGGAHVTQGRWIPAGSTLGGHMDWHLLSPFDLSQIPLVGGGLLFPCSSPAPPVLRCLVQVVTVVPGPGRRGWQWSVFPLASLPYLKSILWSDCWCECLPLMTLKPSWDKSTRQILGTLMDDWPWSNTFILPFCIKTRVNFDEIRAERMLIQWIC